MKTQKELIMAQSSILFWEKGYAETSMKDIAAACGFRPANIYNFFDSKESILYEILQDEMSEILSPIKDLEHDTDTDPVEALTRVIRTHLRLTLGEKRVSILLFDAGLKNLSPAHHKKILKLRDDYDQLLVSIIARGKAAGQFAALDEKLAAYSIASMIVRTRLWYSPKGKYSLEEITQFIISFALHGLARK